MTNTSTTTAGSRNLNVDAAVRNRYSRAADEKEAALCCPVDYDPQYLRQIPAEILERDYGCGDPSRELQSGEVVLDLGSGGGKICYIAAQIVGPSGKIIGVDCNDDMLALARTYQPEMSQKLGYDAVEFKKGRIQDLKLNLELLDEYLAEHPIHASSDWLRVEEHARHLCETSPLIPDESVDVVVSNCVLNLVRREDRQALFSEIHRAIRHGGRAVISDIVSDEDVPEHLQRDANLWSGCLSGAFREDEFIDAFENAGFCGLEIVSRQQEPWAVIEGIEFRSLTVRAFKGKEGPCLERNQAIIYNGPWRTVIDDDGHQLSRGRRMAVCDKTFQMYSRAPYADQISLIPPHREIPIEDAQTFACEDDAKRSPRDTKRGDSELTVLPADDCCGPDCC